MTSAIIPWRGKFRCRFWREGEGWFWALYLGVFTITFQWRYCYPTYDRQIGWIPLKIMEGGLIKCLLDLTWKKDKVQEYLKSPN